MIKSKSDPDAVLVKDRQAVALAGGDRLPPLPPVVVALDGEPERMVSFMVRGPASILVRAERERAKRGLRSRNDAIVAVLAEGLVK